jgi:hypothetical protein
MSDRSERIEVRCCCNPARLLGTVPVPLPPNEYPMIGQPMTFALMRRNIMRSETGGPKRITLTVGEWEDWYQSPIDGSVNRDRDLALISNDTPMETLRRISGWRDARERNGIREGDYVTCIDVPGSLGRVLRCDDDGVDVRWSDGQLGEAVWRQDVAHNAYRFQTVRFDS